MSLSLDVRLYLVRRWYLTELGRPPTTGDQAFHAEIISSKGVDAAYAGIYDSPDARKYRDRVGRKV